MAPMRFPRKLTVFAVSLLMAAGVGGATATLAGAAPSAGTAATSPVAAGKEAKPAVPTASGYKSVRGTAQTGMKAPKGDLAARTKVAARPSFTTPCSGACFNYVGAS